MASTEETKGVLHAEGDLCVCGIPGGGGDCLMFLQLRSIFFWGGGTGHSFPPLSHPHSVKVRQQAVAKVGATVRSTRGGSHGPAWDGTQNHGGLNPVCLPTRWFLHACAALFGLCSPPLTPTNHMTILH